jgi:hypothetical protein
MFEAKRSPAPSDAFDVRKLPAKYTAGLDLIRGKREAHFEAMRRAIDDGYDFRIEDVPKKTGRIRHLLAAIARTTLFRRVR